MHKKLENDFLNKHQTNRIKKKEANIIKNIPRPTGATTPQWVSAPPSARSSS